MRGENTWEGNLASSESQTHNHQVMSSTHTPLSHPGEAVIHLLPTRKRMSATWCAFSYAEICRNIKELVLNVRYNKQYEKKIA